MKPLNKLTIALDYDNTFTADPDMWDAIVKMMQRCGHEVIIVSMRYEGELITRYPRGVMIYYTGRKAKVPWCEGKRIPVDIWIDDQPAWLLQDSV